MIKKDKLEKLLTELLEVEENLVPLFNRHISSSFFYSHLTPESQEEMVHFFKTHGITRAKHCEQLQQIKEDVEKRTDHVF